MENQDTRPKKSPITRVKPKKSLYYYLKGFSYLGSSFFLFKNALTPLCLNRNKSKGQSSKNTTLTPTKTLPKK